MKNKIEFLLGFTTDKRLRDDIKAIKIAGKGYAFYGFELCKKTGIITELEKKPQTVSSLSKKLNLKNTKMLEALLDFLVGKKILEFKENKYSLKGLIPQPFTPQEQEFIDTQYKGSQDWTLYFYEFAEEALRQGTKHKKTGFDDKKSIDLWDSVMMGPLYSLRKIAVKKLLRGINSNERIVDYGCGSGTSIIEILEKSNKPMEIIGLDTSKEMLKMAEERINLLKTKNGNVKLIKKDLSKAFHFNPPFDHAFASILINHIPENKREQFYAQIAKSLRPNGKLVIFQLVNKDKFNRIFSDWLLNVVPSHHGFPFLDEYLNQLRKYFSKTEVMLDGMIIIAHK